MILGISAYFHDAAAAIVHEGKVLAFSKEERFTRIKHNSVLPVFAIEYCLEKAGITIEEVDEVVFYEDPALKFSRILVTNLADFPRSFPVFLRAMKSWLKDKLWVKNKISKALDIHPGKIRFVPHHISHIAQGFLPSPFDEAAFLTLDAVGEWSTATSGFARKLGGLQTQVFDNQIYPHSLGLVYSAFTAFLGFKPNSQEGNTMALAGFGEPVYAEKIRALIEYKDGILTLDRRYFQFYANDHDLFTPLFIEQFGEPRKYGTYLPFDVFDPNLEVDEDAQRFANIAASIQAVFEEIVLKMADRLYEQTETSALCLSGGVALNAVGIGRLINQSKFTHFYVPPDPGDGGAAFGAALYASYEKNPVLNNHPADMTYLGSDFKADRVANILAHLELEDWEEYKREGIREAIGDEVDFKIVNDEELIYSVCDALMNGKIVGWYQGRAESGPRALGNRSILSHPGDILTARRLMKKVKSRASYRPYAISVAEEDAFTIFDFPNQIIPNPARRMQMVQYVKDEVADKVRAAIHIDGTTRPQICGVEDNPRYHALLTAFGERTGLSAILNTSFNESGYPIVNTPEEALIVFARTEMDTLVINNLILQKTYEIA